MESAFSVHVGVAEAGDFFGVFLFKEIEVVFVDCFVSVNVSVRVEVRDCGEVQRVEVVVVDLLDLVLLDVALGLTRVDGLLGGGSLLKLDL